MSKKKTKKHEEFNNLDFSDTKNIFTRDLADACEEYNKIFGANKNLYRIIPSMQDGLKPVARRFLYSLYKGKGRTSFIKMAKAAANTMDYHPHGGASVEDVGAKMANEQFNNIVTVEGQGNFGSYKNEESGASRYIECRLSKYALKCFFEDFESSNVDMKLAYTGDDYEPEVLPARYPHVLFNPQLSGIGYAFASNIPPFNVTEVLKTTIKLIKNPKSDVFLIPDSPTGADIVDDGQFKQICDEGVGTFTLRGSVEVDEINNIITITSIPLQTTIDGIIKKIVELREKRVFDEIQRIDDYTKNETGVKTIIYLTQSANPYKTIEKLYKKNTGLKKTYPVGLKLIDNYTDYDYSIKSFLLEWIEYRRDTVRSSFNTKLVKAMEEQNMNDILLFICNKENAEKTIKMARECKDRSDFASKLMKTYNINSLQANTIAMMRIYNFNKDAYANYKQKKIDLKNEIETLEFVLDNDSEIDKIIIEQLEEGIKLFGSPRKSKIVKDEPSEEVNDTDHIIGLSKDGYIKKVPASLEKIGQVGNNNGQYMVMKVNNRENIFIFDSNGIVSKIPLSVIPDMSLEDTGIVLERYFPVSGNIISVLTEPSEKEIKTLGKESCVIFLTKMGYAKKIMISEFLNVNGSMNIIKLSNDDELIAVDYTTVNSHNDIILYTNFGNGIRRDINEISVMKPNAKGTRQLSMGNDEYCVGLSRINPDKKYLFYMTSAGRVKLTNLKYFPVMKRKDDVLPLIKLEKKESLIAISSVSKDDDITVYKKKGEAETIHLSDLKISSRIAKSEKAIKLPKGDIVVSYRVMLY